MFYEGQGSRANHKLDTRHESFTDFVSKQLEKLHVDLIAQCERIAVHRELKLKMEAENANRQIAELNRKIELMSQGPGGKFGDSNDVCSQIPQIKKAHSTLADLHPSSQPQPGEEELKEAADPQIVCIDEQLPKETEEDDVETCFELWPEWAEADVASQSSPSAIEAHESQLEIEWLRDDDDALAVALQSKMPHSTVAPDSPVAMIWDFLGVPILLYDLVTLPLQAFWKGGGNDNPGKDALDFGIILYWTTDIFLRLLVIGFPKGPNEVELRRSRIMLNYIKHSLLFDLIVVVPDWISMLLDMPMDLGVLRVFKLMRFMRLLRMRKLKQMSRKFQDHFDSEYLSIWMNIVWNMLIILGCSHYIACLWFWVGQIEIEGYENWVVASRMDGLHWEYQYLTCLHWALCQFTPGSMSVQPVNTLERLISIVVLLWGMVFFSLFVSSVTQERMRLKGLTQKMDRDNWMLRRYMKQHKVARGLCARVVKYVDAFVAPMMMHVQRKDVALLDALSRPLQLEVQAEIWCDTLLVHPFLASLKSKSHTMASNVFCDVVAEISLAKNDLLFEVGQVSHEMFFIAHGVVGYLHTGTNDVSPVHDYCCEQVIWVPWFHKGTSRAVEESYLLSVDSAKFRTEVLEYRERADIRTCAQAYLQDLNRWLSSGKTIDDLIHMDQQDSDFVKAVSADLD